MSDSGRREQPVGQLPLRAPHISGPTYPSRFAGHLPHFTEKKYMTSEKKNCICTNAKPINYKNCKGTKGNRKYLPFEQNFRKQHVFQGTSRLPLQTEIVKALKSFVKIRIGRLKILLVRGVNDTYLGECLAKVN